MSPTRRDFLELLGTGAAVGAAVQMPLNGGLHAAVLDSRLSTDDDNLIHLDNNENAYGLSPKVADAIQAAVAASPRYPYLKYAWLAERIAAAHSAKVEQVILGCGSTEILRMATSAFLGQGKRLVQASPTFEAIEHYARVAGSEIISVPLTKSFAHDLEAMHPHVTSSGSLIYMCNPNNPTGSLTGRKDIESFIHKLPASTIVLIDEAYHHYAGQSGMYASFIDHPLDDPRVIVLRTFSNIYALAGLRLGYAIAPPELIRRMLPFATQDRVNAIVLQAAAAALDDAEAIKGSIRRNSDDRQEFFNQAMARMLKPIDSHTNFVMMNTSRSAEQVIRYFRTHNILIGRYFPAMSTHIRVSLGRPEEMKAFWKRWDMLPQDLLPLTNSSVRH